MIRNLLIFSDDSGSDYSLHDIEEKDKLWWIISVLIYNVPNFNVKFSIKIKFFLFI